MSDGHERECVDGLVRVPPGVWVRVRACVAVRLWVVGTQTG